VARKAGLWNPRTKRWAQGGVLIVGFVHSHLGLQAVIVRQHQQLRGSNDGGYELVDAALLRDLGPGDGWDPIEVRREAFEKKKAAV
jgi:hypothetical protein